MAKYERPVIMEASDLAEAVYMASGDVNFSSDDGHDCYVGKAHIHQDDVPGVFKIQVDCKHQDVRPCRSQTLVINFNMPVQYRFSQGRYNLRSTATCLMLDYDYWNNAHDNIGLGDIYVKSELGLAITQVYMIHNY